ncbi:MAG: hypothetical protein E7620_07170 [Ruminococcaceae bacterium]|nr:hypothetical protein [Oscillospiraceae bacterium]
MATLNTPQAAEQLRISRFGGLKQASVVADRGASMMRNFRILEDGSLEKRCGYRVLHNLNAPIRGVWEGTLNGETLTFAVGGNTVYRKRADQSSMTAVYQLTTNSGRVTFFMYRNRLYLLDGVSALIYRPALGSFSVAEGYTPLYGRNWHPTSMGKVNEPVNLLQNRVRIHYLNTAGSTVFQLPFTAKQIDRLYLDDKAVTSYSFTPDTSTFTISSVDSAVRSVEVSFVRSDAFDQRDQVLSNSTAALYTDPIRETVLIYGSSPYTVYCSRRVTDEMLAESARIYTGSDPLYLPEDNTFAVGSPTHPITCVCQFHKQALIMNQQSVWALRYSEPTEADPDPSDNDPRIYLLSSGIGCSAREGALVCGNRLATVQLGEIYLMNSPVNDPSFCTFQQITQDLQDSPGEVFTKSSLLYYRERADQLWWFDPAAPNGVIRIYDKKNEVWFTYDGIPANNFFELDGELCFSTDSGGIYLFDETEEYDNGKRITAVYQSHYLEPSHPELLKRCMRVCLGATVGAGELTLELDTDRGSFPLILPGACDSTPDLFDRRVSVGKFRFLRYRIISQSVERCRIHFLSFSANH